MQRIFAIALFVATSVVAHAQVPSSDWRALPLIKDGAVDPAWTMIGYGKFVVDEKTIRTEPSEQGLGLLLFRPEKFGDCEIRVVFKTKEAKSNAGVYVRIADGILKQIDQKHASAKRDASGGLGAESLKIFQDAADADIGPWYAVNHGYEVQICDNPMKFSRTGAVYSLAPSAKLSPKKPDEWKTMLITLNGERIFVDVDGERVTNFDPASKDIPTERQWYEPRREPKRPTTGYLGLQTHDPGDTVWFQEISVRALKK